MPRELVLRDARPRQASGASWYGLVVGEPTIASDGVIAFLYDVKTLHEDLDLGADLHVDVYLDQPPHLNGGVRCGDTGRGIYSHADRFWIRRVVNGKDAVLDAYREEAAERALTPAFLIFDADTRRVVADCTFPGDFQSPQLFASSDARFFAAIARLIGPPGSTWNSGPHEIVIYDLRPLPAVAAPRRLECQHEHPAPSRRRPADRTQTTRPPFAPGSPNRRRELGRPPTHPAAAAGRLDDLAAEAARTIYGGACKDL